MRWIAGIFVIGSVGAGIAFIDRFNPYRNEVGVLLLLVAALLSLAIAALLGAAPQRRPARPAGSDLAIVVAMNVVLCALWLPHWNNWRWAYTGDSIAWYGPALDAARHGLERSLLSMRGVDFHFTYLHSLGFNWPMFVFEPTFFWHRVGKLLTTALSMTAVWLFFRVTVGRWWALAISVCTALNFYLVRMSFVSYGHIDSLFFCFNAMTIAALLWRRSDDRRLWLLAGLNAGLALYFTQTAWTGVAATGLLLAGMAIVRGRFADLAFSGATFVICVLPIVLQWPDFLHLISSQTKPNFTWSYLAEMLTVVFRLPYDSGYLRKHSVPGGFLQTPLGAAYLGGVALAVIGLWPEARRRLRLPGVTPPLLALLALEIFLMTVMNNGYLDPSPNRTYHLIPLQIFFACLPFIAFCGLLAEGAAPRLRTLAIAATVLACGLYVQRNLSILLYPPAFLFGSKTTDGLIELRQRHPDKHVLYLAGSSPEIGDYRPGSFFDSVYHVADTVSAVDAVDAASVAQACASGALVCCHSGGPCTVMSRVVQELANAWTFSPYPTVNSNTLSCLECRPAAETANAETPAPH